MSPISWAGRIMDVYNMLLEERGNSAPITLMRRSMDTANKMASNDGSDKRVEVSGLGMFIFGMTILGFMALMFASSYFLGHVLPTLCAIESPETSTYVPVSNLQTEDGDDQPPAYEDEEDSRIRSENDNITLTKSRPYTSSIRATFKHLRARGGFFSPIRGLGIFFAWGILRSIITQVMSGFTGNLILIAIAAVIAEVLLAHIHMTWIHIVISEPSDKRWWTRMSRPTLKTWLNIAPAVAVWAVSTQFVHLLPLLITGFWNTRDWHDRHAHEDGKQVYIVMSLVFATFLLAVSLFVLLEIPAMVTLVRVAASMLPEEDETIVTFDRTYGGKVVPAIVGGDGKIDMFEAWRSFPWVSRKRLVLLCGKAVLVSLAVWVVFTVVIVIEGQLLIGPAGFSRLLSGLSGVTGRQ